MHAPFPQSGSRLLVVDDQPEIRSPPYRPEILEEEGFQVDTAANGRAALECLHRAGCPCPVLLDLMMPVMNGWEFVVRLRGDPGLARTPFIVLTGVGDARRHADDLGASAYLDKPVDLGQLLALVHAHTPH